MSDLPDSEVDNQAELQLVELAQLHARQMHDRRLAYLEGVYGTQAQVDTQVDKVEGPVP